MSKATGTLFVDQRNGVRGTYAWNGNDEDRAKAQAAFEVAVAQREIVSVVESPGKSRQVRTWQEVLDAEKELGQVVIQATVPLVGG